MRDFYDIYVIKTAQMHNIDHINLRNAFSNTSTKRGSRAVIGDAALILDEIQNSSEMAILWSIYQSKFEYAAVIVWDDVIESVRQLCEITVFKTQDR